MSPCAHAYLPFCRLSNLKGRSGELGNSIQNCENPTLRKRLKTRGVFPNDESIVKVLYLALQGIAKRWTQPIRDWKAALNQCGILFGERVPR